MNQLLTSLKSEKNTLLDAYESSRAAESQSADDLVSIYQELFISNAPHVKEQPPSFQKVSIVDPTIKTVLQSTTTA